MIFHVVQKPFTTFFCSYDYLQVVIKPEQKDSVDEKLCGNKTGETNELPAAETHRYAELTFHTDNKNRDKGFHITYRMLQSGKY